MFWVNKFQTWIDPFDLDVDVSSTVINCISKKHEITAFFYLNVCVKCSGLLAIVAWFLIGPFKTDDLVNDCTKDLVKGCTIENY